MLKPLRRVQSKITIGLLIFLAILIWSTSLNLPDNNLHIKVLDVGEGDSIFIRTPNGSKILVDGGPNNRVLDYLGSELPFYDKTLDLVVLTHPEKDHISGLIEVAKRYRIKNLWVSYGENNTAEYEEWRSVLEKENIEPKLVWSGDKMIFPDGVELEVISPKLGDSSTSLNSTSIVLLVDYKNFEGLLTGDADKKMQPYMDSTKEVEFFKVPHHGAKEALDRSFTETLSPEVSVISVGLNNRYKHPHQNSLEILMSIGSEIYRTDQNGTVEIVTDGESWYATMDR